MSTISTQIEQVHAMLKIARAMRADPDPLLAGQIAGIIGRLTAMLAVLGETLPEDALDGGHDDIS